MGKVLVACEESQRVTIEMRKIGIEAYSCDTEPCSGGHPEWHFQCDVREVLDERWDLMIAHPPCTYLAVSGARWLYNKDRSINTDRLKKRNDALDFVNLLLNAPIPRIALENPVSIISSRIRKPEQIIQPYEYGDPASKKTCLWLKNLPLLVPTNIVTPEKIKSGSGRVWDKWFFDNSCIQDLKERSKARSKTFPGIAEAIATQWGKLL